MTTWSWILSTAFFVMGLWVNELTGRKVWWVWIPVIVEQVVWAIYSALTDQWGFVVFGGVYVVMYARNLKRWHGDREQ